MVADIADDECSAAIWKRHIRACVPAEALLSRLGGDEFAVLVTSSNSMGRVGALAADLVAAFDEPFYGHGRHCRIGVSVGNALATDRSTLGGLLRDADVALYRSKADGRNTLRFFDVDDQAGQARTL